MAKFLEHTVLKADTTLSDVQRICEEAVQFGFAAVCIPPCFVKEARRILGEDNPVRLATVVGFPMGYAALSAKSEEIKRALEEGANDIDAVINIAYVKSAQWNLVRRDIEGIALATSSRSGFLKLILEAGFLSQEELQSVCEIAIKAGVPCVKTGTGFQGFNATEAMVKALREQVGPSVKIKAAGGIRDAQTAQKLIDAGADLLGSSSSVNIVS
ncbi:MAG: deoxyribose-phosphate aldolase [Saprospiraceae bacterium]